MNEQRLTDIEIRYSYLEDLVQQLSDLAREQANEIDTLKAQVKRFNQIVEDAGAESDIDPGHYPPPHY
jgi:uncharacterized coiled-coil protein SlyX